jgi:hypothetical protein
MATSHIKNCKSKSPDFKVLDITTSEIESSYTDYKKPPEGWYNQIELAKMLELNPRTLREYIRDYCLTESLEVKTFSNEGNRPCSYFKLDEIKKHIAPKPPKGWYTIAQISDIYKVSYERIKNILHVAKRLQKVKPIKCRSFTGIRIMTCDFFELSQVKPYIDNVITKHLYPPKGWFDLENISIILGRSRRSLENLLPELLKEGKVHRQKYVVPLDRLSKNVYYYDLKEMKDNFKQLRK